jgi:predicted nucleic acid-binding protein
VRSPAVIDTNVASFLFGKKTQASLYEVDLKDRQLVLSFQTVGEMLYGAEIKNWGKKKRAELTAFIKQYGTSYPDDEGVVVWVEMQRELWKNGKTLTYPDSWVAATALASDLPLIAHDAAFRFVPGLKLICRAPDCPTP